MLPDVYTMIIPLLISVVTLWTSSQSPPPSGAPAGLDERIAAVEQEMLAWRRYLHEHPELSNREVETAKFVADKLRGFGLQPRTGIARHGVVAVLKGDAAFGALTDLSQVPPALVTRLRHYFLTYKLAPDREGRVVEIRGSYGREDAHEVIRRSRDDYEQRFGAAETTHAARASRQRSRRGKASTKARSDRRSRK